VYIRVSGKGTVAIAYDSRSQQLVRNMGTPHRFSNGMDGR